MDQIKIGKFISESRKAARLTQEQLGEQLGVSKNAVSKWERGLNLPDVSLMQELCRILNITLNELFAGERLAAAALPEQAESNILDILQFSHAGKKKYRLTILLISILLILSFLALGRELLIKWGFIMDTDLQYTQMYIHGEGNIQGDVDTLRFGRISIDFDIGANQYGQAVFKEPQKAFRRLKSDYAEGISLIRREFGLLPLNRFTRELYKIYGWQVTEGTAEEQEQARFVSAFLDIYENSFN